MVVETKKIADTLGIKIPEINLGGGFGVYYTENDVEVDIEKFMRSMIEHIEKSLDEHKLELFINAPSQSEFLFNSGYNKESLFNSTSNSKFINTDVSQKEENYTVQLWKEWGIMK